MSIFSFIFKKKKKAYKLVIYCKIILIVNNIGLIHSKIQLNCMMISNPQNKIQPMD